jgi:hypothetical protein
MECIAQMNLGGNHEALRLRSNVVPNVSPPKGERLCQGCRRINVEIRVFSACACAHSNPRLCWDRGQLGASAGRASKPFSNRCANVGIVVPAVVHRLSGPRAHKQVLLSASVEFTLHAAMICSSQEQKKSKSVSKPVPSPNNRMQRAALTHKVLCRGRDTPASMHVGRARVPTGRRAGADAERWAALC